MNNNSSSGIRDTLVLESFLFSVLSYLYLFRFTLQHTPCNSPPHTKSRRSSPATSLLEPHPTVVVYSDRVHQSHVLAGGSLTDPADSTAIQGTRPRLCVEMKQTNIKNKTWTWRGSKRGADIEREEEVPARGIVELCAFAADYFDVDPLQCGTRFNTRCRSSRQALAGCTRGRDPQLLPYYSAHLARYRTSEVKWSEGCCSTRKEMEWYRNQASSVMKRGDGIERERDRDGKR